MKTIISCNSFRVSMTGKTYVSYISSRWVMSIIINYFPPQIVKVLVEWIIFPQCVNCFLAVSLLPSFSLTTPSNLNQWASHCQSGCTAAGQMTALPPLHQGSLHWLSRPALASPSLWTPLRLLREMVALSGARSTTLLTFCCQPANRKWRVHLLSGAAMGWGRRWGWRADFMSGRCCGSPNTGGVMPFWAFLGRIALFRPRGTMCWWGETHTHGAGNSKPISSGMRDRVLDFTQKRKNVTKIWGHSPPLHQTLRWHRHRFPSLSASCWSWMLTQELWDLLLMAASSVWVLKTSLVEWSCSLQWAVWEEVPAYVCATWTVPPVSLTFLHRSRLVRSARVL